MTTSSPVAAVTARTTAREAVANDAGRLGPWRLLSLAATGEFARVYQAQPADGRQRGANYAIKVLAEKWADNPAATQRFVREAAVGRCVSHPHLISVLSAQVQSAPLYLVMPWLEGTTLAEQLRRAPLPLCRALWIVRQAAQALDALHAAGWTHGDIKPGNLLVSAHGHTTLLDLGFARRTDEEVTTANCPLTGTPHHLAPELLTSTLRGDIRSDIYSLGSTLYQTLAGRPPFDASDLSELATQHRTSYPTPVRQVSTDVPQVVARLVHRMLAKEPLRRPQTPSELVAELTRLEIDAFKRRS